MTWRRPDDALVSNRQRHGATQTTTQTTPWSPIPTAQPHTRDTPTSNPHGTAPPTRHARRPSPRHRISDDTATTPSRPPPRAGANDANAGPAPRPPDYKREPFATHSGDKNDFKGFSCSSTCATTNSGELPGCRGHAGGLRACRSGALADHGLGRPGAG